jgi:DNA replication protein DnaC
MNRIPTDIYNILSDRKARSQVARDNRIRAIYSIHPDLEHLDRSIRTAKANKMIVILDGGDLIAEDILIQELERQRDTYLQLNHIAPDYDLPIPFCARCNDEGWVVSDVSEPSEEHVESEMKRLPLNRFSIDKETGRTLCKCVRDLLVPLYLEQSGLDHYPGISYATFTDRYFSERDKIAPIYDFVRYVVSVQRVPNLLFWGEPGTGKTFLAICILRELIENGFSGFVVRAPEMMDIMDEYRTIKRTFSPNPQRDKLISGLREKILLSEFLVIDELGVEPVGLNNTADLLQIIGERLINERVTIITTNLDLKALASRYDGRLYSRLMGNFYKFQFPGRDIRIEKKKIDGI